MFLKYVEWNCNCKSTATALLTFQSSLFNYILNVLKKGSSSLPLTHFIIPVVSTGWYFIMQYSRSWIELESGQSVCIIRNPEKRSDATRQNYCHVFWVDHLKTRNQLYAFKKTKKQQQYTHCKLVVGVNGSFPHRSGIVKTLHVVGFVEAAVVRQGRWSLKWKKGIVSFS